MYISVGWYSNNIIMQWEKKRFSELLKKADEELSHLQGTTSTHYKNTIYSGYIMYTCTVQGCMIVNTVYYHDQGWLTATIIE